MRFVGRRPRPFIRVALRYARQCDIKSVEALLAYSPEGCITKESRSQYLAPCVVVDLAWERAAPPTTSRNLNGLGALADVMAVETIRTSLWDLSAVRLTAVNDLYRSARLGD